MNLFLWMIVGITISIAATRQFNELVKGGVFGAIALGVFGAIQGGFIANLLLNSSLFRFDFPSLFIAMTGAAGLLGLGKVFSASYEGQDH